MIVVLIHTHTPFEVIFEVNLRKPVASLILILHSFLSWVSSFWRLVTFLFFFLHFTNFLHVCPGQAKTLHAFLFEVGRWGCPQASSDCNHAYMSMVAPHPPQVQHLRFGGSPMLHAV